MIEGDLILAHLRECPVWTLDSTNEFLLPVRAHEPLPSNIGPLIIRAHLTTSTGVVFEGAITNPPVPHVVTLFIGDKWIGFNKALPQYVAGELERLYGLMEVDPFPLFPLRYETDFHFPGEPNIAGVFNMDVDTDVGR